MLAENELWKSDIDKALEVLPELAELRGKTVLITGASGLICSAVVDILIRYNKKSDEKIRIIVVGRNRNKMIARFGELIDDGELIFIKTDFSLPVDSDSLNADYIIHGAGNAYPESIVREPVETMTGNINGMKALLDSARLNGTKRVLYVSSSEVYGKQEKDDAYSETEYGYIDPLNFRNSYSIGKLATETLCRSYLEEYGVDTVIVRPGHIYGPTASKSDNRVSSMWAYDASNGIDIVMKSDGMQLRSYCYCVDCASAMLKVLLLGKSGEAYNISNRNSIISIKQMAETIAAKSGVELKMELPNDEEKKGFNPMKNSSLNSDKIEALGWKALFSADEGFDHTIRILKDQMGK